jgi:hypothetical protein
MSFSRVVVPLILLVSLVFFFSSSARTAEQASTGFTDAPGKELLMNKCFQCHSENMWKAQKQDRRAWEGVLYRMVGRGALWTEDEINTMAGYLAIAFGPQAEKAASK